MYLMFITLENIIFFFHIFSIQIQILFYNQNWSVLHIKYATRSIIVLILSVWKRLVKVTVKPLQIV